MKESQCRRIDSYIKRFGSITRLEAFRDLGVGNFGARYTDMLNKGYPLLKKPEKGKNRYGETVHFYRYYYDEKRLPDTDGEN